MADFVNHSMKLRPDNTIHGRRLPKRRSEKQHRRVDSRQNCYAGQSRPPSRLLSSRATNRMSSDVVWPLVAHILTTSRPLKIVLDTQARPDATILRAISGGL